MPNVANWPDRFFVEFDLSGECPLGFMGDPVIVLFFQSWAFSLRFGAAHELAQAAAHLERQLKIDLKPLLKYADRDVETAADQQELQRSWQPAIELAACARNVAQAWETPDATLAPLIAGYEHLALRLRELAAMCDWAAARDTQVRMSFDLSEGGSTESRPPELR
jgi:hypothetical protein